MRLVEGGAGALKNEVRRSDIESMASTLGWRGERGSNGVEVFLFSSLSQTRLGEHCPNGKKKRRAGTNKRTAATVAGDMTRERGRITGRDHREGEEEGWKGLSIEMKISLPVRSLPQIASSYSCLATFLPLSLPKPCPSPTNSFELNSYKRPSKGRTLPPCQKTRFPSF